jgi:hypothetical protein
LSKVQVDTIDTRSGTSTMQIGSTNTSTINIGVSGDTVNIPSGVTIANAGTATGFGANTPAFAVNLGSNQSISNATDTKVQFNSEVFDTDNAYDNSSNYRFTPQTAGKYFIYMLVLIEAGANNNNCDYVYGEIRKNGTAVTFNMLDFRDDRDGRKFSVGGSVIVDMNGSSDYVEGWGTGSFNVTGDLRFAGGGAKSIFGGYKIIT